MLTLIHVSQRHSPKLYVTLDPPLKVCVLQNSRQPLFPVSQKYKENYITMSDTSATTFFSLFHSCLHCIRLGIVCESSKHCSKYKKYAKGKRNCHLWQSSVRFRWLLKKKTSLRQDSRYLREQLATINDRMTDIKNLEDKVMLVKDTVNDNNQETTKSPT